MSHPTPTWDAAASVWRVDLRSPWGFGRRVVNAPPPPVGLIEAIHASRDLLESLREKHALADAQLALPETAGRTVSAACQLYLDEREYRGTAGKWLRFNVALLKRELAGLTLRDLMTKEGAERLAWWRDGVRSRGVGPLAMKDRLNVLSLVWRWCAAAPRQWVTLMPVLPSYKSDETEVLRHPAITWIDESTFRAVRGAIYESQVAHKSLGNELRAAGLCDDAAAIRDHIERRKFYLSFAFYTGMRRHDLNEITDAYLSLDFNCYWRHGRKTGVEVAPEAICKPFARDIAAERARLGRDFRKGELICGGPWFHATRVIATAARKLGVEKFDLMTCRRSFVYIKAMAGTDEKKLVNLMGHTDSHMIHSVYLMLQPRLQRDEEGARWIEPVSAVPGTGDGRILRFPGQ